MSDAIRGRARVVFAEAVVPACAHARATLIDGGTAAGVMQLAGQIRREQGADFPLVGVAATGTVCIPGSDEAMDGERVALDENHSHFLLVPGNQWGDESAWIVRTSATLAAPHGCEALVIGGGRVTAADANRLRDAGARVLAVAGTGGVADDLAAAGAATIGWRATQALHRELIRRFAGTV
jgi:hypothetical protein